MMRPVEPLRCNHTRVHSRIQELGKIGALAGGGITRLALTDSDHRARDLLVKWMKELQLEVQIDGIGNIFGIRWGKNRVAPIVIGSHLDSVIEGGLYDGSLGVVAGLELIEILNQLNIQPNSTVVVASFTNEEGVRFVPDMMGSLVCSQSMSPDKAWAIDEVNNPAITIKSELMRIGYLGNFDLSKLQPSKYFELHIEQGPVLEEEGFDIGIVEGVQGIFWTEFRWQGQANQAGTTPMSARKDAGLAGASLNVFVNNLAADSNRPLVATVGMNQVFPGATNIIPGRCRVTVDLRSPQSEVLNAAQVSLEGNAMQYASDQGLELEINQLVRIEPVLFDPALAGHLELVVARLNLKGKRIHSGAGHDAQMMQRMCPSVMVFIPSCQGISHSPDEYSRPEHIQAGVNVLINAVLDEIVS